MKRTFALAAMTLALALAIPVQAEAPAASLDAAVAADLQFMREEEKLARDVYAALGAQWQANNLVNIQRSEQQHTTTLAILLHQYGLADPAASLAPGKFADATLQSLYAQLVREGSSSRSAALKVGAAIEEIDIRDLGERIARTPNADVRLAYENLRQASWRHLASFVRNLEREGLSYAPQYLDAGVYAKGLSAAR